MARKSASGLTNARSPSPDASDRPTGPLSVSVPAEDRDVVKVNNANVTELKHACDDALKRCLSRPELFKQIHLHTDVRLGLGWLSVFVAAGTALYGYKIEFEKSKPVVAAGLILYLVLTGLQTLYAYFIERDVVFVGKRKTFSKRIITERISISASTRPASTSRPPAYHISLSYVRSTNAGKSLLAKGRTHGTSPYTHFFDEAGVLDQEKLETWVGGLVEEAMDGKTA